MVCNRLLHVVVCTTNTRIKTSSKANPPGGGGDAVLYMACIMKRAQRPTPGACMWESVPCHAPRKPTPVRAASCRPVS
jgi:hypothetical protein